MSESNVGKSCIGEAPNWRKSAPTVLEKLSYILNKEAFCDVSFRVCGNGSTKIIKAHKLILMAVSTIFECMFNGYFKETNQDSQGTIDVLDIDPSSFETMLKFMYYGNIPNISNALEAIGLVNAARKYDIGELEELCWKHITNTLQIENSVAILQAAQLFDKEAVAERTFNFIKKNFSDVLESEDFVNFSLANLKRLLTADDILVDTELEIVIGILRWSEAQCKEQNLTLSAVNKRLVLGDTIKLINFKAIPAEKLALVVVPTEILTFEECTLLFQHISVSLNFIEQLPTLPFSNICRQRQTHVAAFYAFRQRQLHETTIYNMKPSQEVYIMSNSSENFMFQVDKTIKIVGFGFLGSRDKTIRYIVSLKFTAATTVTVPAIIQKRPVFSCNRNLNVDLDKPVITYPDQKYMLDYKIEGPCNSSLNSGIKDVAIIEAGVTFTPLRNAVALRDIKFKLMK